MAKKSIEETGKDIEKVVKEAGAKAEEVTRMAGARIEKKLEDAGIDADKTVKEMKDTAEKAARKAASTAKKAADTAKKTIKKFEPKKTAVVFEADGRSYSCDDIVKTVSKACKGKSAKKLEIYVNAAEGAAYYVLDGEASADYRVEL